MDFNVSKKETVFQPSGTAQVLVSNVFDVFPIYNEIDPNQIVDVEILDGDEEELLDRGTFALIKQRGADPLDKNSGVQWAEAVLGEVNSAVILQQVAASVAEEGSGVQAEAQSVMGSDGKTRLQFSVKLVKSAPSIPNTL